MLVHIQSQNLFLIKIMKIHIEMYLVTYHLYTKKAMNIEAALIIKHLN